MLPMTVLRRAGYSSLRLAARSVAVRSEILQSRHGGLVSTRAAIQRRPSPISNHPSAVRWFQSEGEYHNVADETLESIQDALDALFEGMSQSDQELEVSLSSGVLTVSLPPHGTWVLNKQTPNQQIWWSSPLSGPRRYEYENEKWVFTRSDGGSDTLGQKLKDEIQQIYQVELELDEVK